MGWSTIKHTILNTLITAGDCSSNNPIGSDCEKGGPKFCKLCSGCRTGKFILNTLTIVAWGFSANNTRNGQTHIMPCTCKPNAQEKTATLSYVCMSWSNTHPSAGMVYVLSKQQSVSPSLCCLFYLCHLAFDRDYVFHAPHICPRAPLLLRQNGSQTSTVTYKLH